MAMMPNLMSPIMQRQDSSQSDGKTFPKFLLEQIRWLYMGFPAWT